MSMNTQSGQHKISAYSTYQSPLENRPFDLRRLIAEFGVRLEHILEPQGFYLAMRISPVMPRFFKGDPLRIKDILSDIIIYGLHYLTEGGIVFDLSSETIENNRHRVLFTITVSGLGIPADMMKTIFQPVMGCTNSRGIEDNSNLYIAKVISSSLGGEIAVHNTFGFGTSYFVEINFDVASQSLMH